MAATKKTSGMFFTHIVHDVRLRQLKLCKTAILPFCEQREALASRVSARDGSE